MTNPLFEAADKVGVTSDNPLFLQADTIGEQDETLRESLQRPILSAPADDGDEVFEARVVADDQDPALVARDLHEAREESRWRREVEFVADVDLEPLGQQRLDEPERLPCPDRG